MKQILFPALALTAILGACTNPDPNSSDDGEIIPPAPIDTVVYTPGETPDFRYSIQPWDGTQANDVAEAGYYDPADEDTYHEVNEWERVVTITYSENSVEVTGDSSPVSYTADGAHVNLRLGSAKAKVEIKGSSTDGSLRITGDHRHMLVLDGVNLTSRRGPAINDQDRKRVFVEVKADSYLEDCAEYGPATSATEDRKGCFFAEGNVILSGLGTLRILGHYRHGLATDGSFFMRPGVTLVVEDAAKNAIHVKGGTNTGNGITIRGGYIYANTSAPAGKVLKSNQRILIEGGTLDLNCSGDPAIDPDDNTLSSSACIKTDSYLQISGGDVRLTATGHGGKGINATGAINVTGGNTIVSCAGDRVSDSGDTSTPKGVKTDNNLLIFGGTLSVSAIGSGSTAVEARTTTQEGGVTYVFGLTNAWLTTATNASILDGTAILGGGAISDFMSESLMTIFSSPVQETEANSTMLLLVKDTDSICATYRWPVAMPEARFMMISPELNDTTDYELTFIP